MEGIREARECHVNEHRPPTGERYTAMQAQKNQGCRSRELNSYSLSKSITNAPNESSTRERGYTLGYSQKQDKV